MTEEEILQIRKDFNIFPKQDFKKFAEAGKSFRYKKGHKPMNLVRVTKKQKVDVLKGLILDLEIKLKEIKRYVTYKI